MFRRVVRRCIAVGLLVVATAMALRTPGIWHAHVGGDAAHGHGRRIHPTEASERAARSHPHSHGTHQHTHHGHVHTHGGESQGHDSGHTHSHAGHSHETRESAVSAEPTWHMHFSLFGFEVTLTWPLPGKSNATTAQRGDDERAQIARSQPHRSEQAADASHSATGQERLAQAVPGPAAFSLPADRTAMRFLGIELGPLPCHVLHDTATQNARLLLTIPLQGGLDAQRPATPPPRAHCAA